VVKELAEESPRLFLQILGIAPPGSEFRLGPLRPETAPAVVMPDYVALLSVPGQEPRIFHVEFFTRYHSDVPKSMARYGGSLAWQYLRPVESVLLLLSENGVPDSVPEVGLFSVGVTTVRHEFRTIRLWEQDPEPVLATGDPGLMSWALLMKLGRDGAERLGTKVGATGNEQWVARFLTLGSLRYDRKELEIMLGGSRMGLVEAIMEGSSLVREAREKAAAEGREIGIEQGRELGRQEGREQGREQGRTLGLQQGQAEEARRLLRLAVAARFPGLESAPAIERISNIEVLESILLQHVIGGSDRATVERQILAGAD